MVIATGTVHNGVVQIQAGSLPEGATVMILVSEGDETFELNPADEALLCGAIKEAEQGGVISASTLIASLRRS